MRNAAARRIRPDDKTALPRYELRARVLGLGDTELEVWQVPSPGTPQLAHPLRVAGLHGRNLELVEHRILKRLKAAGIELGGLRKQELRRARLTEEDALNLGLLFRALAPMRSRDRLRDVAEGIEAMGREEAAYWLGMAMHRKKPRRVLSALRMLLNNPQT